MFKVLFFSFILLVANKSISQYSSEGDLISRFRPGVMWFNTGLRPAIPEKVRKYDRLIFDLTYNTWNGDQKVFKNDWNSIGLNTNIIFDIPITKGNTVSFGTGITHSLFRIQHNNLFVSDSTNSYTTYQLKDSTSIFDKNYLGGNSFSVPLEFRFRTKGWKHFKVHIGGKVGYQFNLFSKTISTGENGKIYHKSFDYTDINRLIYSAHVRIGMRNWALYGSYNLNGLFSHRSSSQLNLVQVGLSISLY